MRTRLLSVSLVALIFFGCAGHTTQTDSSTAPEGLFGKAASIRAAYETEYEALKEKAKTEVKSSDDLVKLKDKLTAMEETAKKDFNAAVSQMTFPINIPFVDSTDGKSCKIQSVQITEINWDMATVTAKVVMLIPVEKTAGGQVIQKQIHARMLDNSNMPLAEGSQNWFTLTSIKDYAVNDAVEFNNAFRNYSEVEKLAKLVFKDKME